MIEYGFCERCEGITSGHTTSGGFTRHSCWHTTTPRFKNNTTTGTGNSCLTDDNNYHIT